MAMGIADIKQRLLALSKRRSIQYGVPFVLFVVGGSFGLKEFTNLRYQYRSTKQFQDKLEDVGIKKKDKSETTLEAQYETIKELNTDDWENKRVYRPWEEPRVGT